ncbi:MAG: hypothetical protein IPI19_17830 [Ignavibacteriales bacterium]|nr:hypothetical protein [Ignavibacteriales bacterium]
MKSTFRYSSIKYILILSSVLFVQCAATRTSELYQTYDKVNYVYWSDSRKLTWEDFQGKPIGSNENYVSEIHLYNPATIEKANIFSTAKLTSICVFDKKHSWVNKKVASADLLLYNQVIFNIYELYTRKLRKEFYNTEFGLDDYIQQFHLMTEKNNSDLKDRLEDYRSDADLGKNVAGIKLWEMTIDKELEELKAYKVEYK